MINLYAPLLHREHGFQPEGEPELDDSRKIYTVLSDPQVSGACSFGNRERGAKSFPSELVGVISGSVLAILGTTTGALVGLHEVVGHGLLGYELTHQAGREGPFYQVDGWDNLKAIGNAHSLGQGIVEFFRWISGYDRNGDGNAGFMQYPHENRPPNPIGQAMGSEGQSAWCSIAGSVPGLALDTLSVVGGLSLRSRFPMLGTAIASFGLIDHIVSSSYPISAATMSSQELQTEALRGHDFANFSLRMSHLTGISATAIAALTATTWTLAVPAVAILTYLYTKAEVSDVVPDVLAMKHWLLKANEDADIASELQALFEAYPKRDQFRAMCEIDFSEHIVPDDLEAIQSQVLDFVDYLLQKVPAETLAKAKEEIVSEWQNNLPQDRIQIALTVTSVIGAVTAIVTKILNSIARFGSASLQTAATVFTYISPIFIGASVVSTAYEVYKDSKSLDENIPHSAKMLGVAKLIVSIVSATLLITSLFVPGLNILVFSILIASTIANICLSFSKAHIIQKQFELVQALEPNTWNTMYALLLNHQRKPIGTPMSRPLQKWVECLAKNNRLPEVDPDIRPAFEARQYIPLEA